MPDTVDLSIIRVYSNDDEVVGTAFLVAERRVLTCAHVAQAALGLDDKETDIPAGALKVDFPLSKQKEPCSAQVIAWDVAKDIAVLELTSRVPSDAAPAKLLAFEKTQETRFRSFGFPKDFDAGVWATGVIKGINADNWLQLEDVKAQGYKVEQGFSGGPIWDDDRYGVVGIVVAEDTDEQRKAAFGISSDELLAMLQKSGGIAQTENPYRGLEPFEAAHAQYFFGRTKMIYSLAEKVAQRNFVAVVGPSGSGKSSLIRAGLLPKLKSEYGYSDVVITPTKNPVDRLILGLLEWQNIPSLADNLSEARKIADLIQQDPATIQRFFMQAQGNGQAKRVLVVDQFEELFTQVADEKTRHVFIDTLIAISQDGFAKVVIAIRADFYGSLLADPFLGPLVNESQHNVLPLSRDELREVIEQPALMLGRRFDPGLVEFILQETLGQPGYLPLLEFALTQLWDKQTPSGMLTVQAYDDIGRVAGAMARAAEQVVKKYEQQHKTNLVRQVFVRLVQPGLNAPDTRRRATKDELSQQENAELWDVVKDLADARLVVTNFDTTTQDETVEVSHEALIKGWARLGEWVDGDREFLTWRQSQLDQELRKWELANRDDGALLRGEALAIAKRWLRERANDIGIEEREYIFHSILHDGKDLQIWMPFFTSVDDVLISMDNYLSSVDEERRAIAVKALRWLVSGSQGDEAKITSSLLNIILYDQLLMIRNLATDAICQRGQIGRLITTLHQVQPKSEIFTRVIEALAYARNIPIFGKSIDINNIQNKQAINQEAILQLLISYRNQFTTLVLAVYLSYQLAAIIFGPVFTLILNIIDDFFVTSLDNTILHDAIRNTSIGIGPLDLIALSIVFLYFYIRKIIIDGESLNQKVGLKIGIISYVSVNIISLMADFIFFLIFGFRFGEDLIIFFAGLIYQVALSVLLLSNFKRQVTIKTVFRVSLIGAISALLFSGIANVLLIIIGEVQIQTIVHPLFLTDSTSLLEFLSFISWRLLQSLYGYVLITLAMVGLYFGVQTLFPDNPITDAENFNLSRSLEKLRSVFTKEQTHQLGEKQPTLKANNIQKFGKMISAGLIFLILLLFVWQVFIIKTLAPAYCSITTSSDSSGVVTKPYAVVQNGPEMNLMIDTPSFGTCFIAHYRYKWNNLIIYVTYQGGQGWVKESDIYWFKELRIPEIDPYDN